MGKCMSKSIVQESVIHHISSPMRTDDTVGFALGRLSNSHQTRWVKYDEISPPEMEKPVVSVSNVYCSRPKARLSVSQPEKVHSENCPVFVSTNRPQGQIRECTCDSFAGRPVALAKSSSERERPHDAIPHQAETAESKVVGSVPKPDAENSRAKPSFKSSISQQGQKPFVDENLKAQKTVDENKTEQKPFVDENTPTNPSVTSKKGRVVLKESNQNCLPPTIEPSKAEQEFRDHKCENVNVDDMLPRRISPRIQRPSLTEKEFQALASPRAKAPDQGPDFNSAQELTDATIEISCVQSNKENVPVAGILSSRKANTTMAGSLQSIIYAICEPESVQRNASKKLNGTAQSKNSAAPSHQKVSHAPEGNAKVRIPLKSEEKKISSSSSLNVVGRIIDVDDVKDPITPRSVRTTKTKSVSPVEARGYEGGGGRKADRAQQVITTRAGNVQRSSEQLRTSGSKVDVIKEVIPSPLSAARLVTESTKVKGSDSKSGNLKCGRGDVEVMDSNYYEKVLFENNEGLQAQDFQVHVQVGASESWSTEQSSAENSDGSKDAWEDANEVSADVKAFLETSKKVVLALGPDAGSGSKNVVNNPLFQPTSHVVYGQQELVFSKTPASYLELETLLVTSADRRQSGCGVEGLQIVGSELTELFSNVVKPANSPPPHSEDVPNCNLASSEGRLLKVDTKGVDSNGYQSDSRNGENVKGVIHERSGDSVSGTAGTGPPSARSSNVSVRTQVSEARGTWDSYAQAHTSNTGHEKFVDSSDSTASSDFSDAVAPSEVSSVKGSSGPFPQQGKSFLGRDISTPSSKVCTLDPTYVNNPCLTRFTELCRSPDYLQVSLEDFQFLLDCAVREDGGRADNSHSQSERNPLPSLGKSLLQKLRDSLANTPISSMEVTPRGSCGSTTASSPIGLGLHPNCVALTAEEIAEIWGAFEQSHLM